MCKDADAILKPEFSFVFMGQDGLWKWDYENKKYIRIDKPFDEETEKRRDEWAASLIN
jgi:hypothetical protein